MGCRRPYGDQVGVSVDEHGATQGFGHSGQVDAVRVVQARPVGNGNADVLPTESLGLELPSQDRTQV